MHTGLDADAVLAEGLSEKAIRRTLRSLALQYPTTLVPFSVAFVGLVALFVPIFDDLLSPIALIMVVAGAVLGGISFFWLYSVRHDDEYARLVQRIMAAHGSETREHEELELAKLQESLREGFGDLRLEKATKALNDLEYEYDQLKKVLDGQEESTASLSSAHLPGLADETFREGLNVLDKSLQLSRAIRSSDRQRLENEIADLEKEIELLSKDESLAERVAIRLETVASHRERLELIGQQQLRVDELQFQCDRCEASLSRARIEVAALLTGGSETSVGSVTETLQRTINQAKEVQVELERLGF